MCAFEAVGKIEFFSKLSLCAAVTFRSYRRSSVEVAEENEIDSSHHADRPITNRAILTYAKGVTPFSGFGLSSANPNPNRWERGKDSHCVI